MRKYRHLSKVEKDVAKEVDEQLRRDCPHCKEKQAFPVWEDEPWKCEQFACKACGTTFPAPKMDFEKRSKIEDGHLMIYRDPARPGGGFWCHECETEEQCGNY